MRCFLVFACLRLLGAVVLLIGAFSFCGVSPLSVRLFCLLARLRSLHEIVWLGGVSSLYVRLLCLLARVRLLCAVIFCCLCVFAY